MFIAGVLIQNYTLKEWSKYSSSSSPWVPVKSLSLQCRIKLLMEQCLHVRCLTFFRIKWETRGGERERKREVFLPEKNLHAVITCSSPMTSGLKKNDFPFSQKISLRFTWIAAEKKKRILLYSLTSLLFWCFFLTIAAMQAKMQTDKQAPLFCQKCREAAAALEKSNMEIETSSCSPATRSVMAETWETRKKTLLILPNCAEHHQNTTCNPCSPIHH